MYSKKRCEADIAKLEKARHIVRTDFIAGKVDGFDFNEAMLELDAGVARCKGRLFHTAQELQAQDEERKRNNRR